MQSATWWAASPQLTQYGHVFLHGERAESHTGAPVLHPTVTAEDFFAFLFVLYNHRISEFEGNLEMPWSNSTANSITKWNYSHVKREMGLWKYSRAILRGVIEGYPSQRAWFLPRAGAAGRSLSSCGGSLHFPEPPHS